MDDAKSEKKWGGKGSVPHGKGEMGKMRREEEEDEVGEVRKEEERPMRKRGGRCGAGLQPRRRR